MIYAILDPKSQNLVFASAGHLYPLFINSSGVHYLKTSNGVPLGISDSNFSECEIEFSTGCRLVLYTDGVTEAMNTSLEEYGPERLTQHLKNESVSVQSIIDDVQSFAKGQPYFDDVTVVMIEAN